LILGAMRTIELAGWVARIDDGEREHQHYAQWAINPALLTQFNDHRQAVIAARTLRIHRFARNHRVNLHIAKSSLLQNCCAHLQFLCHHCHQNSGGTFGPIF